jgi:hypothetical protein
MTTKRRGRPPADGQRKTSAEYQRAYRERKKLEQGDEEKTAYFSITGNLIDDLDAIANYFELSRAKAVNDLLTATLNWILPEFAKTAKELDEQINQYPVKTSLETIKQIKAEYWRQMIDELSKNKE